MDNSLFSLTGTLKKIISTLKPYQNPLSLVLLIGPRGAGKSALLRQSQFEHIEITNEHTVDLYYNTQGIIIELTEAWLHEQTTLLSTTLKEINRCHKRVKISGLLFAIDVNTLRGIEPTEVTEIIKKEVKQLHQFGQALGHRVDVGLILTQMDSVAGFIDFFQHDHVSELNQPFGFSLDWGLLKGQLANNFKSRFEHWIHYLEQQVIHKIHSVRSNTKRTAIREFPLQMVNLRHALNTLVTGASHHHCRVQSIYFTSAEQGGVSTNHLDKKISDDYALTVQQYYAQSTNYRAYFIEGALLAFQKLTQRHYARMPRKHLIQLYALASAFGLLIAWIAHHYVDSRQALDHLSKELLAYDFGIRQGGQDTQALFHLSKAASIIEHYTPKLISSNALEKLKITIKNTTNEQLQHDFLPILKATIENILISPQESPAARYEALKIYLMLNTPSKRNNDEILVWFKAAWEKQAYNQNIQQLTALLKHVLRKPAEPISINQQVVRDVRNYLNALPMSYFYYSLAKKEFSESKETIAFPGFTLPVDHVPFYFTKPGFDQTLSSLPNIVHHIEQENWVLERTDLKNLVGALEEAYCYDYVLWWQHFTQKVLLSRANTYQEASQTTQVLYESEAIQKLIGFIQTQTSPDFKNQNSLFNRLVASQFTTINLISPASIRELIRTIRELQPFLMTLSVVNDQGRSAFIFSKMRFENTNHTNPLTQLYDQAQQFPQPISGWMKQLADNAWYLVMNDTKHYINTQWQQLVFQPYTQTIASRYPFEPLETKEVSVTDFNHFFAKHGVLQNFISDYLKPFIDTSTAQWKPRSLDDYQLPLSETMMSELMRANVITAMFFPRTTDHARIEFSLQKMMLDPVIEEFELSLGNEKILDTQKTDHLIHFRWPESGAKLLLTSIEGQQYELTEAGPWAFFKMLQKINVLTDEEDSSMLQILFEVNGNAGRYLLKTVTPLNPFTPGILNGFALNEAIASS